MRVQLQIQCVLDAATILIYDLGSVSRKQLRNTAQTITKCTGIALSLNSYEFFLQFALHHSEDARDPFYNCIAF